jgi:dUTP pyrophosphatase
MNVKIKRIDTSLPLPEYHTSGAVAFDLYSREDMVVQAKSIALIPANFIIEVPTGYALILTARSSLAKKKGLMLANGVGTIDNDYCGPEDEIKISVYNFTDSDMAITKGERLAQGLFMKIDQGQWEEVSEMEGTSRGGFGTTGEKI